MRRAFSDGCPASSDGCSSVSGRNSTSSASKDTFLSRVCEFEMETSPGGICDSCGVLPLLSVDAPSNLSSVSKVGLIVVRLKPARCCHVDCVELVPTLDIPYLHVSKKSSKRQWNCGITSPVVSERTRYTFLVCVGLGPKFNPMCDLMTSSESILKSKNRATKGVHVLHIGANFNATEKLQPGLAFFESWEDIVQVSGRSKGIGP